MKKKVLLGIVLLAIIGASAVFAQSLDGGWERADGRQITISGSGAVTSVIGSPPGALQQDGVNKGYTRVGGQALRNLRSTGNLAWSGQTASITHTNSSPNVATGTSWVNCTITMSANGQTIDVTGAYLDGTSTSTYTRKR
jgi:hypothetical protein